MMNKVGKAVLIGGILIVLGGFIAICGMFLASAQNKNNVSNDEALVEKEYVCENVDKVNTIELLLVSEDIEFEKSDDKNIVIDYYDNPKTSIYNFYEKNGKLTMERTQKINGFFGIFNVTDIGKYVNNKENLFSGSKPVVVYIPERYSGSYDVNVVSGDVSMNELASAKTVEMDSVSGTMRITGMDLSEELAVASVSGDISLDAIKVKEDVKISTTSGDISFADLDTDGELVCSTTSGSMNGLRVTADEMNFDTTSGDVFMDTVTIKNRFVGSAVSGGYHVVLTDERKEFTTDFDVVSGSCNQAIGKQGKGSKEISIDTTSGDIQVFFANE